MRGKEKTKIEDGIIKDWEGPKTYGGTIGGLDLIGGGAIKGLAKFAKPFLNTAKQYAQKAFGKVKPKFPNMSARDKKFFKADGSSRTGDLYASATDRATTSTSNFRPLITGNKVYGRKEINDAFAQRFGKPQNVKNVTDGWSNTVEGVAKGVNVGAKPLTSTQKALVNQKDIIKNSATLGKTNFFK